MDDEATRNTLRKNLEQAGHRVTAWSLQQTCDINTPVLFDTALFDLNVEHVPEAIIDPLSRIAHSVPTLMLYGNSLSEETIQKLKLGEREMMFKKCLISDIIDKLESFQKSRLKAA